jgi:hypothetical protein
MTALIEGAREFDIELSPDGLVLCEMETPDDMRLAASLRRMDRSTPSFVAIIGYTFGRSNNGHDDWISFAAFERKFKDFDGDIYIIEPQPEPLCEMLADRLKSNRVIGVRAYWNVLSHVCLLAVRGEIGKRSINWVCEDILDRYGSHVIFPVGREEE